MTVGRVFLDTNVSLYAYGVLRGRVRKLRLPAKKMRQAVGALLEPPFVTVDADRIVESLEIEARYRVSFWDALILAAAEAGRAGVLYTEDLSHGQTYGSVTARSPFR